MKRFGLCYAWIERPLGGRLDRGVFPLRSEAFSVPHSIPQYLKQRLDPSHFDRLRSISQDFTRPLFALDPQTGRFEAAADLEPEEIDDEMTLDALCFACELLSDADVAFDVADPVIEQVEPAGTIQLSFDFPNEDDQVFRRFKDLLRENTDPAAGFHTQFQKYPWGHRVVIDLFFRDDLDYQRKKDHLDLLLLVAQRRSRGLPFQGTRL